VRIGLVARADRTGLAVQTWCFWRNMHPHRTLIVDLSHCSGQQPEVGRYGGLSDQVSLYRDRLYPTKYHHPDDTIDAFLDDVDVVFTCETPYNYWLFDRAREKGVRTVLQYNFEFLEYLVKSDLPRPDLLAAPSLWHFDDVTTGVGGCRHAHLPVPVDLGTLRAHLPARRRTELRRILHTVGHPTGEDRNGTRPLIDAMHTIHARTGVELVIRSQRHTNPPMHGPGITVDHRSMEHFWETFDVAADLYVMPRRFGGLCLPVQEALGLGMPVLMSDESPQNRWLPANTLIPATRNRQVIHTRAPLHPVDCSPKAIADAVIRLHERPDELAALSDWALTWAAQQSWDVWGPIYHDVFASLG